MNDLQSVDFLLPAVFLNHYDHRIAPSCDDLTTGNCDVEKGREALQEYFVGYDCLIVTEMPSGW